MIRSELIRSLVLYPLSYGRVERVCGIGFHASCSWEKPKVGKRYRCLQQAAVIQVSGWRVKRGKEDRALVY